MCIRDRDDPRRPISNTRHFSHTRNSRSAAMATDLADPLALPPALNPISGGFDYEAFIESSRKLTRPAFPLPVAPGWSGHSWASSLMLRTLPLPATHVRAGTDHEHLSGTTSLPSQPSNQRVHSSRATSCRTQEIEPLVQVHHLGLRFAEPQPHSGQYPACL